MRISLRAVIKDEPKGEWAIYHTGNGSALHNHKPSSDPRVHSAHRKRSAQAINTASERSLQSTLEAQSAAGIPVANIYGSMLLQKPDALVIPKDISNAKDGARRRALAKDTPMEALFKHLRNERFFYRYTVDQQTQRLEYLMWAHPVTAILYKTNSDILVMDCTYKINQFGLPPLNVITLTGMDTALPVCQAWLPREQKPDYTWVLNMLRLLMLEFDVPEPRVSSHDRDQALMNALAVVFPDVPTITCRWHMNKNVLSKTREVLGKITIQNPAPGQSKNMNTLATDKFMALFYRTVDLETEEELIANKAALVRSNAVVATYLSQHWWKYEDKIVKVRTNRYMHFGIRDTSTVEDTHAQCKRWIKSTRGDLFSVFNKLLSWWVAAAKSTSEALSRNKTIVPHRLQYSEFAACVKIITNWALYETDELWNQARRVIFNDEERKNCTGTFRAVHDRPCVHELITIIESESRLHLMPQHFDKHWWIRHDNGQKQYAVTRVLDPPLARAKGARKARQNTHVRNHGATGTARDLVHTSNESRGTTPH